MENESKFFKLLEKYIMGPLGKMAQFQVVRAIMGAGVAAIPFTIVGSMFLVFNVIPQTFTFLEPFFESTFFKFRDLYMLANTATMGVLALYFNLALGYEYAQIIADDEDLDLNGLSGSLLSLFAFLMAIPQLIFEDGAIQLVNTMTEDTTIVNGWQMSGSGVERFGTVGIFTGIIMAIVAVNLYKLCVKKNWIVRLPEEVPEGVARAFTALIPSFVVAFTILIINAIFVLLGTDIFQVVEIPFGFVTNLTNNVFGVMVIYFIIHALWLVGIHGANIIMSLLQPITLANMAINAAGNQGIFPLAGEFNNAYVTVGGSGATLLLTFYLAYMAKSKQLSAIGKASLIPSIFNINEPLIFGLPIIYNPYLAIPFLLAPMVVSAIAFLTIQFGLVSPMIALLPWPSPVGIGAFIGTGGDWRAAVLSIIVVVIAGLIYLPFIRVYDQKLVAEEQENVE